MRLGDDGRRYLEEGLRAQSLRERQAASHVLEIESLRPGGQQT